MIPKNISFGEEAFSKMVSGINKLADATTSTLGPSGKTVIIQSSAHTAGKTVTKDGVTVADAVNLLDQEENIAVEIVRESAQKTVIEAGDGTTTTISLVREIISQTQFAIERFKKENKRVPNMTLLTRAIEKHAAVAISFLDKNSMKLNKTRLKHVASISGNNDPLVGGLVESAFSSARSVAFEKSIDLKTSVEVVDGMSIERGWTDKGFCTTPKGTFEAEEARVLVCNRKMKKVDEIEHLITECNQEKTPLVIIGDIEEELLNALVLNHRMSITGKTPGFFRFCHVLPPSFGADRQDAMEDVAVATEATLFSESTGDNLQSATIEDLGLVSDVIVSQTRTIFRRHKDVDAELIEDRLKALRELLDTLKNPFDIEKMNNRINMIDGGVAIIGVGGVTPSEQKELYDRVEDAVKAVYASKDEGILPGGGMSLLSAGAYISSQDDIDNDYDDLAIEILAESFKAPIKKMMSNAGLEFMDYGSKIIEENSMSKKGMLTKGYNILTMEFGDMVKMGIIDPAKVTKCAISNAVSSAKMILNSDALITNMMDNGQSN